MKGPLVPFLVDTYMLGTLTKKLGPDDYFIIRQKTSRELQRKS